MNTTSGTKEIWTRYEKKYIYMDIREDNRLLSEGGAADVSVETTRKVVKITSNA